MVLVLSSGSVLLDCWTSSAATVISSTVTATTSTMAVCATSEVRRRSRLSGRVTFGIGDRVVDGSERMVSYPTFGSKTWEVAERR